MKLGIFAKVGMLGSLFGFGAIYLLNASWLAPTPQGEPILISHRGVYQTYNRDNLGRDDCTAIRIFNPEHRYLENTIPSMEAAFAHGADIVELDIHPTTDGEFAVFHDWTLDCRTNGSGVTREHAITDLKKLDVGYGYTFDGGTTFPFRGQGIGLIPTLKEVFQHFPDRQFLINIKSNDPNEADRLNNYLRQHQLLSNSRLMVYGGTRPIARIRELRPKTLAFSKDSAKSCVLGYLLVGWSGYIPKSCHNSIVIAPNTWQWALWGWPNRFAVRMRQAGSLVMAVDHEKGQSGLAGVHSPEELNHLPQGYSGAIWVEKIEIIGPFLRAGSQEH
ncbi:glycerophosphodiester phosphodiesterase family protein [Microbulbifer sp. THAF38]|uniref:glycerophosphodiester phosphodiesterase family protein n=1 Tax=Microbulbifer sp. THAF38 TaxID=2587856 RepID=UPI00126911E3|nr:glycerophosphodiester phosphodiesterase family protein [Microbulbifer sp. THAF38]QFT53055.1 cytoplasmic glycerophosphodiester phosphodiesterase [Microbulbifer sp. THAF38]